MKLIKVETGTQHQIPILFFIIKDNIKFYDFRGKSKTLQCCQIKTGTQHQILFFIIKDFGGKFHRSISQRLFKFYYLYRLLTIQEIDVNNPKQYSTNLHYSSYE